MPDLLEEHGVVFEREDCVLGDEGVDDSLASERVGALRDHLALAGLVLVAVGIVLINRRPRVPA